MENLIKLRNYSEFLVNKPPKKTLKQYQGRSKKQPAKKLDVFDFCVEESQTASSAGSPVKSPVCKVKIDNKFPSSPKKKSPTEGDRAELIWEVKF